MKNKPVSSLLLITVNDLILLSLYSRVGPHLLPGMVLKNQPTLGIRVISEVQPPR